MPHRDSDLDGITTIAHRADVARRPGFAGFGDSELHPHTEGTALTRPPRMLILICQRPAHEGGDSIVVDGRDLYDTLASEDPGMLTALCADRSVYFGHGRGHLGRVFEPAPDGRVTIRLRLDGLVRFSSAVAHYAEGLRRMVEQRVRTLRLVEGEGFALLNNRWLHGRTQFTGNRIMLRVLGNPQPALALPSGFAPRTAWLSPATV